MQVVALATWLSNRLLRIRRFVTAALMEMGPAVTAEPMFCRSLLAITMPSTTAAIERTDVVVPPLWREMLPANTKLLAPSSMSTTFAQSSDAPVPDTK